MALNETLTLILTVIGRIVCFKGESNRIWLLIVQIQQVCVYIFIERENGTCELFDLPVGFGWKSDRRRISVGLSAEVLNQISPAAACNYYDKWS